MAIQYVMDFTIYGCAELLHFAGTSNLGLLLLERVDELKGYLKCGAFPQEDQHGLKR